MASGPALPSSGDKLSCACHRNKLRPAGQFGPACQRHCRGESKSIFAVALHPPRHVTAKATCSALTSTRDMQHRHAPPSVRDAPNLCLGPHTHSSRKTWAGFQSLPLHLIKDVVFARTLVSGAVPCSRAQVTTQRHLRKPGASVRQKDKKKTTNENNNKHDKAAAVRLAGRSAKSPRAIGLRLGIGAPVPMWPKKHYKRTW